MKKYISALLMLTVALSLVVTPISVSYAREYHNPNSKVAKVDNENDKKSTKTEKKSKESTQKEDSKTKKSETSANASKESTQKEGGLKALVANKSVFTAVICIAFIIVLLVIYITGARKRSKEDKLKE